MGAFDKGRIEEKNWPISGTYKRDLWYPGPSTIGLVAKNYPNTIKSLSNSTRLIFKKFLKTL